MDIENEGFDVYNTMLTAMEVSKRLGPSHREAVAVDGIGVRISSESRQ